MGPRYSVAQWSALVASVLLALSVAVGAGLAVADSGSVPDVADRGPASDATIQRAPAFLGNRTVENSGDVATVGVDVANSTAATLRIGSADDTASDFTAAIAVEDRDGDGRIDVRVNTYTLGRDDRAVAARGDDTADVRRSSSLDAPLRAGNYSLTLLVGNETVDESTLVLEPPGLDGLTLRVANSSVSADLSSRAAIRTAVENGTIHESDRLSLGDTLVVELAASGLSGALASQPGPNATARFLALLDEPGFSLTIRENGSTINQEQEGNEFLPTTKGTTVVPDADNDTYYVLLDLARLPRRAFTDPGDTAELEAGDVFDVNVTVTETSGILRGRQSVESSVETVGWVTVETPVRLASRPNQSIVVRPNLTRGTPISVVLTADDGPFRTVRNVEVTSPGRTVVTFDLSNRSVGETLTLVVKFGRGDEEILYYERNAVRMTEGGTPTATPTQTASPTPTGTATPTERSTTTTAETTPTDDSSGSIPGFGVVAALLAVVAAAAVAASGRAA